MTAQEDTVTPTPTLKDRKGLCEFAIEVLPTLRHQNGLYCFDRTYSSTMLRGESVRYSLMVWLGLHSAQQAGLSIHEDLDRLFELSLHHKDLAPGDLGLLLWCDARRDGKDTADLIKRLDEATAAPNALDDLAGMEIGWMLLGLANSHGAHTLSADGDKVLRRVLSHQRTKRATSSALFAHYGNTSPRAKLPNFATQIYAVMALTAVARYDLDPNAKDEATRLADALISMQRPDGGWPWLFNSSRGTVVEPYEVYSVHQDGMAPMGLLALSDVTGDPKYSAAAEAGVPWVFGQNEMSVDFYDAKAKFAHRSIRRKKPMDRVALGANSIASTLVGSKLFGDTKSLELNDTCRPYHLGWILEAWASRLGGETS